MRTRMRTWGRWLAIYGLLTCAAASADTNDLRIYKLGNPTPGGAGYDPQANGRFRIFARELGAALNSANLMPPGSLGHSGFAFALNLSVVDLKAGESDFVLPTTGQFSGPLLIPSLHIRKGLPFSFELGTRLAWIEKSGMYASTLELKWAVNEGFAVLPDISVRAYGTRLLNSRDFELSTAGFDLGIGKKFAIGGMITLTPYAGWNLVWVGAASGNVDFAPERTYADSVSTPIRQLQDTGVYDAVGVGANAHNRFYAGLRFIGGLLQLVAEVSTSGFGKIQIPQAANPTELEDRALPSVFAFNIAMGLDF